MVVGHLSPSTFLFFDSLVRRKWLATIAPLPLSKLWVWGHCRIRRMMLDLQLRRNVLWMAVQLVFLFFHFYFWVVEECLFTLMWFLFWYLICFWYLMLRVCTCHRLRKLRDFVLLLNIWIFIYFFLDVRSGFLGTNKRIQINQDFPIHQPSMSRRWDAFGYAGPCVWLTHMQEMAIKRTFKVPMGCQGMHKGCPRLYWSLASG